MTSPIAVLVGRAERQGFYRSFYCAARSFKKLVRDAVKLNTSKSKSWSAFPSSGTRRGLPTIVSAT